MVKTWVKIIVFGLSIAPTYVYSAYTLTVTGIAGTAKADMEAEINKRFQLNKLSDYMQQMSNAQTISHKGQGVSYATEHSLFVVGGSFGGGFNTTSGFDFDPKGGVPPIGVGIQASGMVGLSLSRFPLPQIGPIDLKKLTLFVNYFSYSNDSLFNGLGLKTNTFGIHAQYKLIDGKNIGGIGVLNWGGLLITSGLDVSNNTISYKGNQGVGINSGGQTYTWVSASTSTLSIESSSFSIPIEVSTNVRLLYVLSFFVGTGFDVNFGNSKMAANITGPITDVLGATVGNATLVASDEKGPSFGTWRFFAGPQLNLVPLKNTNLLSIYAQGNYSIGGNYGAHAGIRIAW